MSILYTSCSALIKSSIWLPLLIGGGFLAFQIYLFFALYDPKSKDNNKTPNVTFNEYEIERQLKRQTDLMERDRWDRISGSNGYDKEDK